MIEEKPFAQLSFRVVDDEWWVAYIADPDTMEGAKEIARVSLAVVLGSTDRKHAFMVFVSSYVDFILHETVGEFTKFEEEEGVPSNH